MQIELSSARHACRLFDEAARHSIDGKVPLPVLLDAIEALSIYQERLERAR